MTSATTAETHDYNRYARGCRHRHAEEFAGLYAAALREEMSLIGGGR